jgi:colanic acid/amylovoran biosynthesis protein
VVVTGSYHSAVLALAQGIPVVGFAKSEYYANKLLGVTNEFGGLCKVVLLTGQNAEQELYDAVIDTWQNAPNFSAALLRSAETQVQSGMMLYGKLTGFVS